jgi:hypothetical protein
MDGPEEPGERPTAAAQRELSFPEAERFILGLLKERGPMTTQQIQSATQSKGVRCPDSSVRFLSKLRMRRSIVGTVDRKRGTWVWWLPGQTPPEGEGL